MIVLEECDCNNLIRLYIFYFELVVHAEMCLACQWDDTGSNELLAMQKCVLRVSEIIQGTTNCLPCRNVSLRVSEMIQGTTNCFPCRNVSLRVSEMIQGTTNCLPFPDCILKHEFRFHFSICFSVYLLIKDKLSHLLSRVYMHAYTIFAVKVNNSWRFIFIIVFSVKLPTPCKIK